MKYWMPSFAAGLLMFARDEHFVLWLIHYLGLYLALLWLKPR